MSDDTSLPEIPPETFYGTGSSAKTGMPSETRSASEIAAGKAAEAESNYEKKLGLPEVTEVSWTAKDRKKPKAISELKRFIRQIKEYVRVHSIRNTYCLAADEKKEARDTRAEVMSICNAKRAD